MARKLIVEILGDSRSLERSLNRSTAATRKFGRDVDTGLGRAEARFTSLQRVAAGGFIGGAIASSAVIAIKRVVDVAAESQQVLGQTRVALEATGLSWEQYGKQIETAVQAQSRLGFDDEALLRTFSLFVRQTNDVGQALRENNLAMDVARARFIDLEQAANIVNKAALGQAGALRRLGIDTKGATSGTELLTLLTEKYGGAAQAASGDATTAMDRTKVAVENLEESIGTLLLPAIELMADNMTAAAEVATTLVAGLKAIGDVRIPEIEIPFVMTVGGGKVSGAFSKALNVAKFLPINPAWAYVAAKAIKDRLSDDFDRAAALQEVELANSFGRSISDLTRNALDGAAKDVKPPKVEGFGTGLTPEDLFGPLIKQLPAKFEEAIIDAELAGKGIRQAHVEARDRIVEALEDPRLKRADRIALKRALKTENDSIKAIDSDIAQAVKDANERRKARLEKLADDAKRAAEEHKDKLREIAEKRRQALEEAAAKEQRRQFRLIGLGPDGGEIIPTIENLRKQFVQLRGRIAGGEDVPKKLTDRFAGIAKALRQDITPATREALRDFFREVRGEFEQGTDTVLKVSPATRAINKNAIVEGLGLDRDTERIIKSRLSGINQLGRRLAPTAGTTGAFGITLAPQPINVNTTVNLDGETVARNTTIHQQKKKRSNPVQKRGPLGGI